MLAIAARVLMSFQDLARYLISDRQQARSVPFFRWENIGTVCTVGEDVLFILFLVFVARSKRPLLWFALAIVVDLAIMTEFKFWWLWRPSAVDAAPAFIDVAYLDIVDYMLVLAICALPLSRIFLTWSGVACLAVFAAGVILGYVNWGHGTLYWGPFGPGMGDAGLRLLHDPETLVPDYLMLQLLLVGVFTWLLIESTQEGRRFVTARVGAEAGLAFFVRFFAPAVTNRVSQTESACIVPARHRVAVAFVDFDRQPDRTDFDRLQTYYVRVESSAFAHDGVIDRFSGGPIMVTFGAVEDDEVAAKKALDFAISLMNGQKTLHTALHCGEAVSGEFGGTRSRTFSVIGDVVNTARRVLDVARDAGVPIIATEALVEALPVEQRPPSLVSLPATTLRGRTSPMALWSVPV
jgi:hypothetical protein